MTRAVVPTIVRCCLTMATVLLTRQRPTAVAVAIAAAEKPNRPPRTGGRFSFDARVSPSSTGTGTAFVGASTARRPRHSRRPGRQGERVFRGGSSSAVVRASSSSSADGPPSPAAATANKEDPAVRVVTSMPPPLPPLKNHYYLLRHGQSTANVEGIISSSRSLAGSTRHGLTALGREQGRGAASDLLEAVAADLRTAKEEGGVGGAPAPPASTGRVIFYSSPFARARETAHACLGGLGDHPAMVKRAAELGLTIEPDVALDDGLMERFFGRLDGMDLATYAYVWPVDMFEPTHTAFDVESVAAVSTRVREALIRIDATHADPGGNHIVLTSHADTLQIAQVYASGFDEVGKFSQYRFGNGEVRRMLRTVDSLPTAVPLQPPGRGQ